MGWGPLGISTEGLAGLLQKRRYPRLGSYGAPVVESPAGLQVPEDGVCSVSVEFWVLEGSGDLVSRLETGL